MNIEFANKLASMVEIEEVFGIFEGVSGLVTGVNNSNGQTAVRVMKDGVALTEWFAADGDTVREADRIIRSIVSAKNDAADEAEKNSK